MVLSVNYIWISILNRISDWSVHSGGYFSIWLGPLQWAPTAHCTVRWVSNLITAVRPDELLAQWWEDFRSLERNTATHKPWWPSPSKWHIRGNIFKQIHLIQSWFPKLITIVKVRTHWRHCHLSCCHCKSSYDDLRVFLYLRNHLRYYFSPWQHFLSFIGYIRL